jgi:hypothetical protein
MQKRKPKVVRRPFERTSEIVGPYVARRAITRERNPDNEFLRAIFPLDTTATIQYPRSGGVGEGKRHAGEKSFFSTREERASLRAEIPRRANPRQMN